MTNQITTFVQLAARARELAGAKGPVKAAAIGFDEGHILRAVSRAEEGGLLSATMIGPRDPIIALAAREKLTIDHRSIIDRIEPVNQISAAEELLGRGEVYLLILCSIDVRPLLSTLFGQSANFRDGRRIVSHLACFETPDYPRLLFMSDGLINVAPDLDRKTAIIENALSVTRCLGVAMPKVAVLAAVEMISSAMPMTLDGAILAKMADKGQIKNCLIDGPLSIDVATVPEIARQKGVASPVAGQAEQLIVPNLETGNSLYCAMTLMVKAQSAGVVIGGRVPVVLPMGCDGSESLDHSITLAAFLSLSR